MKKLLTLIITCFLSTFLFSQEVIVTPVNPLEKVDAYSCESAGACAQSDDPNEQEECIQWIIDHSCAIDQDLEVFIRLFEKKKSMTSGIKNTDWEKYFKTIFGRAKLAFEKDKKKGVSFVVLNKETGKPMISIPLTAISTKTFASVAIRPLSMKEITGFLKSKTPSYNNSIALVRLFLKECSISVTLK